jgi:hypothetical protein
VEIERVEPAFRPFQPTQNPEAERVEQAFRPAVSVGKMPALAAEVLFDHSPQTHFVTRKSFAPIRSCTSVAKASLFDNFTAGLKACSTLCFMQI